MEVEKPTVVSLGKRPETHRTYVLRFNDDPTSTIVVSVATQNDACYLHACESVNGHGKTSHTSPSVVLCEAYSVHEPLGTVL